MIDQTGLIYCAGVQSAPPGFLRLVREVCPEFPGSTLVHWSIPDPAADGTYAAFVRTAEELELRVRFLLHTLAERS